MVGPVNYDEPFRELYKAGYWMSAVYLKTGNAEKAFELLTRTVPWYDNWNEVPDRFLEACVEKGVLQKLLPIVSRLKTESDRDEVLFEIIHLCVERQEVDRAVQVAGMMADNSIEKNFELNEIAQCHVKIGKIEEALNTAKSMTQDYDDNAYEKVVLLCRIAQHYDAEKKQERASEILSLVFGVVRQLADQPWKAQAFALTGCLQAKLGDKVAAEKSFLESRSLSESVDDLAFLAEQYAKAGERDSAAKAFQEAIFALRKEEYPNRRPFLMAQIIVGYHKAGLIPGEKAKQLVARFIP